MAIEVDSRVVDRLLKRIIIEEGKNIKTKDRTDSQMVTLIKKKIEEEVKCLSNQ